MGTLGILISLALLMYLAYRGINVLILAPLLALLALLFAGDIHLLLPTYTQVFMKAMGGYVIQFFPLFLLGALFGKLMDDSGSARAIAQGIVAKVGSERAILAIVLACGILTYGGVSLFVVAFAIYPIARNLFEAADIPKRLVPATIALGAFTFTMTALPGSPAIQNAIPIPYFGTNGFAAPGLGLLAAAVMLGGGMAWLLRRAASARAAGEGYGRHDDGEDSPANPSPAQAAAEAARHAEVPLALALLPLVLVVGVNALFTYLVFPALDLSFMAERYATLITLEMGKPLAQGQGEIDLCAGIVDVVFLGHLIAGKAEQIGKRVANDGATAMADMHRASWVGRDIFDIDLVAGADR